MEYPIKNMPEKSIPNTHIVNYTCSWCDYFTICEHTGLEVGSRDCFECKYNKGLQEEESKFTETCDYRKYSELLHGKVFCSYTKNK